MVIWIPENNTCGSCGIGSLMGASTHSDLGHKCLSCIVSDNTALLSDSRNDWVIPFSQQDIY